MTTATPLDSGDHWYYVQVLRSQTVTEAEVEAILEDQSKSIDEDIEWTTDEDHSPAVEFRVEINSRNGWPLVLCGSYNIHARTLTYAMIHRAAGRIYALDLGKDHRNPTGELVGDKHKHRWTEQYRDKHAYAPADITFRVDHPLDVWNQFCAEAGIRHNGTIRQPPSTQGFF